MMLYGLDSRVFKVGMEAQFSSEYEELKNPFLNCINAGQWTKFHSNKHHSHLDVHAAELPQVPIQSFTEVWPCRDRTQRLQLNKRIKPLCGQKPSRKDKKDETENMV